jgi:hypothetical protein
MELKIDQLRIEFQSAEGHEHRVRPIAARAAAIFAARLEDFCAGAPRQSGSRNLGTVKASPVDMDLRAMTDEDAAGSIASAWLDAVTLKLT